MKVKIIDARMGKGKTSWAIDHMNIDIDNRYVYITPFLKEVKRIKDYCPDRYFREPQNFGNTKRDSFHELLADNQNVVSTHSLFRNSNDITKDLIKYGNYVLVLDEVMDVVEQIKLKKDDIPSMLELDLITVMDDGLVEWNNDKLDYDGKYNDIKTMALNDSLFVVNNAMLMWNFPTDIFKSFKEVYILTYMFDSQVQKYYYDMHDIEYEYYTVVNNDMYEIVKCDSKEELRSYDDVHILKELIDIVDNDNINRIGNDYYSLSSTWYKKHSNKSIMKQFKNHLTNYFINISKSKSKNRLWTTFKMYEKKLGNNGYRSSFIPCNIRATNEYSSRSVLAYCINVFLNPILSNFFTSKDVSVNEDEYALSEMLQWIWRSSIRNDESIKIYIPSSRMRELLVRYLDGEIL